ncbi:hypothetical protein QTG54_009939 [Skeletonema marinoi]|uniref:Uncharacterized protein n=1 Tax=Skeletonema marinoi TaxID=267567 RepID=A0AAD8Y653_9STRA|nr:hypothetical protein QTG54_009939 [Skeletonema marinoi]
MAAEAGIDVERHDFKSINAETFEASKKSNSRRNVMKRLQRSNGGKFAPPDFNDCMEKKFKELWFGENKQNPFQGAQMREWCMYAMGQYEVWRMEEITTAVEEDNAIPPLMETNFDAVKTWGLKMKELSSKAQRDGAFNTESSLLTSQLNHFTPTSSPLKELDLGKTTAAADLSVTVVTGADPSAVEFPSPTSTTVQQGMEAMLPRKPPPPQTKKRKKTAPPPDDNFLRRQNVAATVMDKHNITASIAASGRRRCLVCGVLMKDFYFNMEHGVSTKEKGGVPHLTTAEIKFCPLADDHSFYYVYQKQKEDAKLEHNRRNYAKSKGS